MIRKRDIPLSDLVPFGKWTLFFLLLLLAPLVWNIVDYYLIKKNIYFYLGLWFLTWFISAFIELTNYKHFGHFLYVYSAFLSIVLAFSPIIFPNTFFVFLPSANWLILGLLRTKAVGVQEMQLVRQAPYMKIAYTALLLTMMMNKAWPQIFGFKPMWT